MPLKKSFEAPMTDSRLNHIMVSLRNSYVNYIGPYDNALFYQMQMSMLGYTAPIVITAITVDYDKICHGNEATVSFR